MPQLSESIVIHADRAKIWQLLTTPSDILRWFAGLDSLDAAPNYPAVGSTITGAYKVMGIELKATQTVIAATEGESLRYTLEGVVNGTQNWSLNATDNGVELTMAMDYSMSGGVLGKLAEPAVHSVNVTNAKKSLESLKMLAENE
ncbi:MAG: hypothetical protein OHK0023_02430 [Anaerolineae bacterium]